MFVQYLIYIFDDARLRETSWVSDESVRVGYSVVLQWKTGGGLQRRLQPGPLHSPTRRPGYFCSLSVSLLPVLRTSKLQDSLTSSLLDSVKYSSSFSTR